MDRISKRRLVGMAALALLAGAASATPAAAQSRCTAPKKVDTWHSCLATAHRAIEDGPELMLTKARPRLVFRYDRCPARNLRRTVVIRTGDGRRLAREQVRGTCRRGVARWILNIDLEVDLTDGTTVRSYWSGIADSDDRAPEVELKI